MTHALQRIFLCVLLLAISACQTNPPQHIPPKINVAILMPLTGQDGVLGRRLASLMELGLEDGLQGQIDLMTYDASDEKSAQLMMDKIIAKKTKIVLGPLFSQIAYAIMPKVEAHNITVLTLSNNPAIGGGNMYVFGHAPMRQTERVVNYCINKGYRDLILLLPAGNYTKTMSNIIQDMALKANISPVHTEFYGDEPESIALSVAKISDIVDNLNEIEDNATKPVIYVADDAKVLELVFSAFRKHNLDQKALVIGDNRADIYFPDGIQLLYTGSLNYMNYGLDKRASEILNIHHLSFMDLMAYDLGRMTSHYLGQGLSQEQFLSRLRSQEGYIGTSGSVIFNDNIAIRKYDIIERNGAQYKTIEKGNHP
ncbi:MAG: penicillin-binding protein activator [Pseudomonadota bacterium]